MKITLNQLVKISGVSRYHLQKIIDEHQLEPEIESRKNIKVQVFSDAQKQQILEIVSQKKTVKEELSLPDPLSQKPLEQTSILADLSAAKAQVQLLLEERDYLRSALTESQQTTKSMADQLAKQDQRTATIIAALSQPKELAEKTDQKRGFWQRLFG